MGAQGPRCPPGELVYFDPVNREELRRQVEERRAQLGLRWSDLARIAGISTPYLHQLLSGKKQNPSQQKVNALRRLWALLNLSPPGPAQAHTPSPVPAARSAAEAPGLIRRRLDGLSPAERRRLMDAPPRERMAWLLGTLLEVGISPAFLQEHLQVTPTTLSRIAAGAYPPLPRHVERLCALAALHDDFVYLGRVETDTSRAWQAVRRLLAHMEAGGIPPAPVLTALQHILDTTPAAAGAAPAAAAGPPAPAQPASSPSAARLRRRRL